MKVLYLLDESWDSGLTASALTTAALLRDSGVVCKILCRAGSYAERVAKKSSLECFSFRKSWLFSFGSIKRWVQKEGFDILHAHTGSTHTLAWILKSKLPRSRVLRTRADARGAPSQWSGTHRVPEGRWVRKNWFYDRVLAQTDALVFPSKKLRDDFLINCRYPLNRAHVIYPTIEKNVSHQSSVIRLEKNDSEALKITMVGRLDPVKGQEDFIAAAALIAGQFPEATFEIIGEEKNTTIRQLDVLAKRLRVARNVKFRGFLPLEELAVAMEETTVAVVASRGSEVVSRVTLEWMRLGKPLVATRVGVIPELLQEGKCGILVDPGSSEEMAYAIKKLLLDSKIQLELAQSAKDTFGRSFAPEVNLKSHLALYKKVLENSL